MRKTVLEYKNQLFLYLSMAKSKQPTTTIGKKLDELPRWLRIILGILIFALLTLPPALATGWYLENMEIVQIIVAINIFLAVMKLAEFVVTEAVKRAW